MMEMHNISEILAEMKEWYFFPLSGGWAEWPPEILAAILSHRMSCLALDEIQLQEAEEIKEKYELEGYTNLGQGRGRIKRRQQWDLQGVEQNKQVEQNAQLLYAQTVERIQQAKVQQSQAQTLGQTQNSPTGSPNPNPSSMPALRLKPKSLENHGR